MYCYECHQELLHNPVFTPADMKAFADLVRHRGLSEKTKTADRSKLAARIRLLHEVIAAGLFALKAQSAVPANRPLQPPSGGHAEGESGSMGAPLAAERQDVSPQ